MVLFADTGSEKAETYAYLPIFRAWMDSRGIPNAVVRYEPRNFKHWPPYHSLATNMLTNATLPSKAFGRGSCSLKWKVRSEEHTSELQSLMRISYAVFCLKKKNTIERTADERTKRYGHRQTNTND